jgi:asparagine synthase (glutamine-hydrolysing)
MTILAGVFSRDPSVRIPDSVCESLKRNISRNHEDQPIQFRDAHAFFVKVDIGAFDRPAHRVSQTGSFTILAGEPLLTCEGPVDTERDSQLAYLQSRWDDHDFKSLRSASGTFCAAYYDPQTATGHLVADRLGLRTLYYAVVDQFIFFSTALRILEALSEVPKIVDVQAVAEITGFGYPFGAGTAYEGIRMLLPCEVVTIQQGKVSSKRYFEWDKIAPLQVNEDEALKETYRLFQSAVRRRLRNDKSTFAYLSGGLDSRCVVAALRDGGVRTYTFNFSLAKTQDQVFAMQYANKCGAIHQELPTEPGPNWSAVMADAWSASPYRNQQMPEHPMMTWTGEGGSVGLGHVYISPEMVDLLRTGNRYGAIDIFLRQQSKALLTRILNPDLGGYFKDHLRNRLRSELDAIHHPDPVRAFYIFLNLNGPRRHLVNHFETIDQHRLEFQVPFYDSEFLEYLTAVPVEPCLYHQSYVKWLDFFDSTVLEVPWQAYPGHVPSSAPVPQDLPDQWHAPASDTHRLALDSALLDQSRKMLANARFPNEILHGGHLRLMHLAWRFGLGKYDYALKAALVYWHYFKNANGKYQLPNKNVADLKKNNS